MDKISRIRSLLRAVHNCILLSALYGSFVVLMRDMQQNGTSSYRLQLLTCTLMLSLFFVLTDMVVGLRYGFWRFTVCIVGLNVIVLALSSLIAKDEHVVRSLLFIFCIAVSMLTYYEHNKEKTLFYPSLAVAGVYVFIWLLGVLSENHSVRAIAIAAQVLEIFLFIIYHELTNLWFSVNQVKDRAYVPVDMINYQNKYELFFFMVPMAALTGLCFLFPYGEQIAGFLYGIITKITRFVVGLMTKNDQAGTPKDQAEGLEKFTGFLPPGEADRWERFWDAVFILAAIFVIAFIVWVIVRTALDFYRRFQKAKLQGERQVSEFLTPEEKKKEAAKRDEKPGLFDLSEDARVRRIYKRFIKKQPESAGLSRAYTPLQIEEKTLGENRSRYERLHEIYEKARYSHESCSRAEVGEVRRMGK